MRLNLPVRLTEHIPPCLHTNTRVVGRLHSAGGGATLPRADVETCNFYALLIFPAGQSGNTNPCEIGSVTSCVGHLTSRCAAPNLRAPAVFFNNTIDSMRSFDSREVRLQHPTSTQLWKRHTLTVAGYLGGPGKNECPAVLTCRSVRQMRRHRGSSSGLRPQTAEHRRELGMSCWLHTPSPPPQSPAASHRRAKPSWSSPPTRAGCWVRRPRAADDV